MLITFWPKCSVALNWPHNDRVIKRPIWKQHIWASNPLLSHRRTAKTVLLIRNCRNQWNFGVHMPSFTIARPWTRYDYSTCACFIIMLTHPCNVFVQPFTSNWMDVLSMKPTSKRNFKSKLRKMKAKKRRRAEDIEEGDSDVDDSYGDAMAIDTSKREDTPLVKRLRRDSTNDKNKATRRTGVMNESSKQTASSPSFCSGFEMTKRCEDQRYSAKVGNAHFFLFPPAKIGKLVENQMKMETLRRFKM